MQNAHFIVSRAILSSTKDTFRRCFNLSTKHLFTTPYLVHKIRISRHTRIDLFNRNFSSSGPKSITDSPVEKINAKGNKKTYDN